MIHPAAPSILHVDLDCFFAAAEIARNPALRGKPVVVGGGPAREGARLGGSRGIVCTASYEARAFGIRTAMPFAQAQRLCPHAVFLPVDFHHYEALSRRFHAILADYTPDVEPLGLDEAFLDLTGCEPIAGPPQQAAQDIRRRVRDELSLTCSAGLAPAKVVAKVASDQAKPDGLLLVPPGQEASFLAPLPIRALPGIGQRMEQRLLQLGLRTIGDLACLPGRTLETKFGALGRLIWYHARGLDPAPVQHARETPKSVSREVTFPHDIDDPALLRATLRLQAERVGADLRSHRLRARALALKLRYPDFTTITRSATFPYPTNADHALYQTASDLLDQACPELSRRALRRDRRALRLIGLGAHNLTADAQLPLLPSTGDRWERLAHTTDRLRAKYGPSALQTGQLARLGTAFTPTLGRLYVR